MDEAAQAKFLLQDLKRYDDDLVKKQWLATNEKQITEQEVTEIRNLKVQEVRAIEGICTTLFFEIGICLSRGGSVEDSSVVRS